MQQNLFAKLSQNELLKYRDIKTTVENNSVHSNEINRGSRSSHNKSTYSPPPRMIRQKNLKQALDAKRERPMSSQTEERVHPKPFRKALEFTKETKNNKEQSYMKKETFYPCSKTWANFSLDTEALIAVFNMNMDLRKSTSFVKG